MDEITSQVAAETPPDAVTEGMDAITTSPDGPVSAADQRSLEGMMNLRMEVQVVLGRVRMPVSRLLQLGPGALLDLDRSIGEPVEVIVGDQLIARGTLVQTTQDRVGVSLTEILREPAQSG